MKLIEMKCKNCGELINLNPERKLGFCSYCGTKYVFDDSQDVNYVTNNISAGVVNMYGGADKEFEIRGGTLFKYNGNSPEVTIPAGVVSIEKEAFMNYKGIKKVNLPEGLVEIGEYAFSNCSSLESIALPNSLLEIKEKAFSECTNLKSITIPESVKEIGEDAFSYQLNNVTISCGNESLAWYTYFTLEIDTLTIRPTKSLTKFSLFAPGNMCVKKIKILSGVTEVDARFYGVENVECDDNVKFTHMETRKKNFDSYYVGTFAFRSPYIQNRPKGTCPWCGGTLEGRFSKKCVRCPYTSKYHVSE